MITTEVNKIDVSKLKVVPHEQKKYPALELCVYGEVPEDIKSWISTNVLLHYKSGPYTNIIIPEGIVLNDLFTINKKFTYMDGFSPNLNKNLHIGHFANLVTAKSLKNLNCCQDVLSIYGDTEQRDITKIEALKKLEEYYTWFDYCPDIELYASGMKYTGNLLVDGTGEFEGCKVVKVGDEQVVAIKSDGTTSYFYQDIALAEKLNANTLYIVGKEQENHFNLLKKIFPTVHHLALGLIKIDGKKMASRNGNVIYLDQFLEKIKNDFPDIKGITLYNLAYNIFAGLILRSTVESDKNIDMTTLDNPKNSPGLYISYTMARLHSSGVNNYAGFAFKSTTLQYLRIKSINSLNPIYLFDGVLNLCNNINSLYKTHQIKDNPENLKMFSELYTDLLYGVKILGMFKIEKV